MLTPISVYDTVRHWDELAALLAPAIATDTRTTDEVKVGLITGELFGFKTSGGVIVVTQGTIKDSDEDAVWVLYAAGKSTRSEYLELLAEIERNARFSGCAELRIEGRRAHQWARVLGGFDHVSGTGDSAVYRRRLDG